MIRGFIYVPDFLSDGEEDALLSSIAHEPYVSLAMRGQWTRRSIVSYGLEFRPHVGQLAAAPDLPAYLHWVRARAAALVGVTPGLLAQSLITKYPEGSDIGWHIDHQSFGDIVVSISLLGDATLRLRDGKRSFRLPIARRSIYILRESARFEYEHKVTARSLRYSITFRPIASTGASVE